MPPTSIFGLQEHFFVLSEGHFFFGDKYMSHTYRYRYRYRCIYRERERRKLAHAIIGGWKD